ncbi:hypothetical protein M433DRAFT_285464 [Acidomyces richmondensis BFW]|nr:MAG: hypothetical protein FE78DRAFT_438370 [Acidomyces sp. 'richmondensis']KYG44824.1 hypothetical protein M433DRAFT_285464 [Acidomyces richmondensis BFW]
MESQRRAMFWTDPPTPAVVTRIGPRWGECEGPGACRVVCETANASPPGYGHFRGTSSGLRFAEMQFPATPRRRLRIDDGSGWASVRPAHHGAQVKARGRFRTGAHPQHRGGIPIEIATGNNIPRCPTPSRLRIPCKMSRVMSEAPCRNFSIRILGIQRCCGPRFRGLLASRNPGQRIFLTSAGARVVKAYESMARRKTYCTCRQLARLLFMTSSQGTMT